jgi:hypothetical protein
VLVEATNFFDVLEWREEAEISVELFSEELDLGVSCAEQEAQRQEADLLSAAGGVPAGEARIVEAPGAGLR